MSTGLNRVSGLFYANPNGFQRILNNEKILRRVDSVYLIDSSGTVLMSETSTDENEYKRPTEEDFNRALEGSPVFVADGSENKTSVLIKLNTLIDTYLYISRNIEEDILRYLNETEQAVSFYYSVENSQTGIKITFATIYVILVTLLLFLSAVIAISFATRFTKPIVNLIKASENISKGALNTKVPEIESDEEFKMLNKNFNNMIERLKKQQDKLLTAERYSAWETVARKLAHEIKNPLTPIQLSIDRLREKYASKVSDKNEEFENYLQTINRQIKDIENLVNEFSNFARMPRPVIKKINLKDIIVRAVNFYKMSSKSAINFDNKNEKFMVMGDEEQLYRVFINLMKNSEESLTEKSKKDPNFKGKIDIEIKPNNDYIVVTLKDNGTGISDKNKAMTPYFTTKKNGTGLGLPIVNKIINDHKGELTFTNLKNNEGLKLNILLPSIN